MSETTCSCATGKTKERSAEEYKALMNRLNRIERQVRASDDEETELPLMNKQEAAKRMLDVIVKELS